MRAANQGRYGFPCLSLSMRCSWSLVRSASEDAADVSTSSGHGPSPAHCNCDNSTRSMSLISRQKRSSHRRGSSSRLLPTQKKASVHRSWRRETLQMLKTWIRLRPQMPKWPVHAPILLAIRPHPHRLDTSHVSTKKSTVIDVTCIFGFRFRLGRRRHGSMRLLVGDNGILVDTP